jgi:hypothetical protein
MQFLYNFEYDKLKLKEVVLLVPKNHPSLVSLLTPALALYGIATKDFLTEFEKITSHLEYDLVVPLNLTITKIKTFQLTLKTVSLNNILHIYNLSNKQKFILNTLFVYKLLLLKSIHFNKFLKPSAVLYKNLKNYLELAISPVQNNKRVVGTVVIRQPNIHKAPFGVFFSFFVANSSYLTFLKTSASLFNVNLTKISNSFFPNSILKGNNFLLSSSKLINLLTFLQSCNINTTNAIGFKTLFVNWSSNVMPVRFFTNKLLTQLPINNIRYFICLMCFLLRKTLMFYRTLNIKIIKLYANLPTITKKVKA